MSRLQNGMWENCGYRENVPNTGTEDQFTKGKECVNNYRAGERSL